MDSQYELYGQIRKIVKQETKWLRHYVGSVLSVDDPLNLKRVQVAIQELGWTDTNMGIWAAPRDKNSSLAPAVGAWVEIYFIMGDPARPVYLGGAVEHMISTPPIQQNTGKQAQVIFEDPNDHSYLNYNESNQQFDFSKLITVDVANNKVSLGTTVVADEANGKVTLIQGTEAYVLGTTLNTWLGQLIAWLTALALPVSGATAGPPAAPPPTLPTITSSVIAGK